MKIRILLIGFIAGFLPTFATGSELIIRYICEGSNSTISVNVYQRSIAHVTPITDNRLRSVDYISSNSYSLSKKDSYYGIGTRKLCSNSLLYDVKNEQVTARVSFGFNDFSITKQADAILKRFELYSENNKKLSAIGNTDAIGDENYNDQLGLKRAINVIDSIDITDKVRVSVLSNGENIPISTNLTKIGRALNRHVSIKAFDDEEI